MRVLIQLASGTQVQVIRADKVREIEPPCEVCTKVWLSDNQEAIKVSWSFLPSFFALSPWGEIRRVATGPVI